MAQIRVAVQALDPLSLAGLTSCLSARSEVVVVSDNQRAEVVVIAVDRLGANAMALLRNTANEVAKPIVLITNEIKEAELLTAVECRVVAILPRNTATEDRVIKSVRAAAAGGGDMPPNLLGQLLSHTARLQREVLAPNGLTASGLSPREIDVLRLMADGWDTSEIAGKLCYSERTVKNIIYSLTNRLNLRNRPHAVAYAMRAGVI